MFNRLLLAFINYTLQPNAMCERKEGHKRFTWTTGQWVKTTRLQRSMHDSQPVSEVLCSNVANRQLRQDDLSSTLMKLIQLVVQDGPLSIHHCLVLLAHNIAPFHCTASHRHTHTVVGERVSGWMSEWILNDTSAQSAIQFHSCQYTLENTGHKTNQKQTLQKLNKTQKKQTI